MNKLPFVTPPPITAAVKLFNSFTDNRHSRSTDFCTVSSSIHRLCGNRQWQCAACSKVHVVWGSGLTRRTSGKCSIVISFIICSVHKIYSGDQILDHFRTCQLLQKHFAPCSFVSYGCLSQLFYINCTVGRSTKAVCGFHRLIKRSKALQLQTTNFMNTFIKQRPVSAPNFTHYQAITVQKCINIDAGDVHFHIKLYFK
jgi:hypothetical protein